MGRLAICLLTCDRPEYTKQTLNSLFAMNPTFGKPGMPNHILLHADDGSTSMRNALLAKAFGFQTVYDREKGNRGGAGAALASMWACAINLGASHILHLENDWESVAPLPEYWGAGSLRLYGRKKERGDGPRSNTGPHIAGTTERIQWEPGDLVDTRTGAVARNAVEYALNGASWGGPPSITAAGLLFEASLGYPAPSIKQLTQRLARIESARVVENVVFHIGEERTAGKWGD